jgi:hypothetical protein
MIRILILFALLAPALSNAEPFVCFTGVQKTAEAEPFNEFDPSLYYQEAALRCETMKNIGTGLQATSVVLSAAAWRMACTGIGAEVAVYLKGGALGFQALNLIVGQLPCEKQPQITPEQVRELTEVAVCEQLAAIGIPCRLK